MCREFYEPLATALTYPEHRQAWEIESSGNVSRPPYTAAAELAAFAEKMAPLSVHDRQELFIQTFDLNPLCALEMGWHLFGENYDRGLLLVKMRQQLRMHGLPETRELPDHLTNGLRLLTRMPYHSHRSARATNRSASLPRPVCAMVAIRGASADGANDTARAQPHSTSRGDW